MEESKSKVSGEKFTERIVLVFDLSLIHIWIWRSRLRAGMTGRFTRGWI